ncbi:MAG TPA: transglycosylase SLT domain-containing protein [Geobacteraceae bacterium]
MFRRCLIAFVSLISLSQQASAAGIYPLPNEQIVLAAEKFRRNMYKDARETALKAPQGGMREFILGISAAKLEDWPEAARRLGAAADAFPLLADYALYYEARALYSLARFTEALPPLRKMIREFPDSPLVRPAQLLYADTLFEGKDFKDGYEAYQKFIEKFPSGPDALAATHKSALCQEQMGDTAGAVASLRTVWLKYPTSTYAAKAEQDLQRLAARGVRVAPYSAEELLRRASTLFDLRKYDAAAKAIRSVPLETLPGESADKYRLKAGQALFRCRRYKDAEAAFSALLAQKTSRDVSDEAAYWLAITLDRSGRKEEAFTAFIKLSESSAGSELAEKALFEAAGIRKGQKKGDEALAIMKRLLLLHPASQLKQSVTWEIAWRSYQSGDTKTAADYFKTLADIPAYREKALYWFGHTLAAAGDTPGAQKAYAALLAEYPFGFYAQSYRKEVNIAGDEISFPTGNLCEMLPLPPGYERIKALITLGLHDEARKELSSAKKKQAAKSGSLAGLARLYLEMNDYHGAYNLLGNGRPRNFGKENLYQWGICFPLAYRDAVARLAAANNVPENLVFAIIRAESSYLPTALSPAGAVGLMQLMPSTAAIVANGSKGKLDAGSLTNPETNIRFGIKHLRDLMTLYNGDLVLAVAAYNAGAGNVNRWRKAFGNMRTDEFVENIPFTETREYVKKVLSSADIYARLYKLDNKSALQSSPRDATGSAVSRPAMPAREIAAGTPTPIAAN